MKKYNVLKQTNKFIEEMRRVEKLAQNPKAVKPLEVKTPQKIYWQIDNQIYNKETGKFEIIKKYVAVPDKDGRFEYKPRTYKDISEHSYYSNIKVLTDRGFYTVKECIDFHYKYKAKILKSQGKDLQIRIKNAAALKQKINDALDRASRKLVEDAVAAQWTPEKKLSTVLDLYKKGPNEPHSSKMSYETIMRRHNKPVKYVACYPYIPDGKVSHQNPEGLDQPVDCGFKKYTGTFVNVFGELEAYELVVQDGFILNTNSNVSFGDLLATKSTVYKIIAKARKWGLTPRTEEGFYTIEKWESERKTNTTVHTPVGIRGMCITEEAFQELQAAVNWYEGNAEQFNDLSDTKTLLHPNGIDSVTLTEYEYYTQRDKYDEWRDATEPRDFQQPLYADGESPDEYEEEADILD